MQRHGHTIVMHAKYVSIMQIDHVHVSDIMISHQTAVAIKFGQRTSGS